MQDNNKAGYAAELAVVADEMAIILAKARDLTARYFDTGIEGDVNKADRDDALVEDMPFNKATTIGMITVMQQYIRFMDGQSVQTDTYRITVNKAAALRE